MVVDDGVVEKWFEEPGINDHGADEDPYTVTKPEVVLEYLKQTQLKKSAESHSPAFDKLYEECMAK